MVCLAPTHLLYRDFVLITYVYNKVFRVKQKLPLLKEILLYVLMALGSAILLVFQIDKC